MGLDVDDIYKAVSSGGINEKHASWVSGVIHGAVSIDRDFDMDGDFEVWAVTPTPWKPNIIHTHIAQGEIGGGMVVRAYNSSKGVSVNPSQFEPPSDEISREL